MIVVAKIATDETIQALACVAGIQSKAVDED